LFSDQYNTINDVILIYVSHSSQHVSAGNYDQHRSVLQQYKRKNCSGDLSFTIKITANNYDTHNNYVIRNYYVHVIVHLNKFLYNKTNRCTNFPNLFWLKIEPLHVSGSSSAHHQEFIHCTLGTDMCHTDLKASFELGGDILSRPCSKVVFKTVWHTSAKCTGNELL